MIESSVFIALVISFFIGAIGIPLWIRKARSVGLIWNDMNKFGKPKNVAGSGGIVVLMSFLMGSLIYIAIRTFLTNRIDSVTIKILALLMSISIAGIIGIVDDFLGWHHGGLPARIRVLMAIGASIPLIVINAGNNLMSLPFFGNVNFGLLYPLFLIPFGIAATTTVYNFLAGFNGLESGLGIISIGFLSYVSFINGDAWLAIIGLSMVFGLIAFLIYNKVPAKIFPGNVLTYSVGALLGAMAIVGDYEKIALIVFIPFIIEMVLKIRGRFGLKNGKWPVSFGVPEKDGSLKPIYDKIYGLTHFSIRVLSKVKKKVYERDVVYFVYLIEIVFVIIAFLML